MSDSDDEETVCDVPHGFVIWTEQAPVDCLHGFREHETFFEACQDVDRMTDRGEKAYAVTVEGATYTSTRDTRTITLPIVKISGDWDANRTDDEIKIIMKGFEGFQSYDRDEKQAIFATTNHAHTCCKIFRSQAMVCHVLSCSSERHNTGQSIPGSTER